MVMFVLIYVDNMIVTGNSPTLLEIFVEKLNSLFALKDLRKLNYFLRIEAYRNNTELYLKQERYVETLPNFFGMTHCSNVLTPIVVSRYLSKDDSDPL